MDKKLEALLKEAFEEGANYEVTLSRAYSFNNFLDRNKEQLKLYGVVKSLPLIEGKTKSNIKNNIPKEKLSSPPPPIKR